MSTIEWSQSSGDTELPEATLYLLADAAADLLTSRRPDRVVRDVFDRVSAHLECDVCTNYSLVGDVLHLEESRGLGRHASSLVRLALGEELCGTCALLRRTLYLDADALAVHPEGAVARAAGLTCYAATPLVVGDRLVGTLAFASSRRRAMSPADLALIRGVGALVVAAKHTGPRDVWRGEHGVLLRAAIDHSTDAMYVHARDGAILDVNDRACDSLGYAREELIGKTAVDIDPSVTAEQLAQLVQGLDEGRSFAFDSTHRRRDGSTFPVEVRLRPFWTGGERYAIALAVDMTARKRAEEALRRSEEMLRRAQAIGKLSSWTFEPDTGRFRGVGWAGETTSIETNTTEEQLFAAIHPDDAERVRRAWDATKTGARLDIEHRLMVRRRTEWVHVRAEPTIDAGGRLVSLTGVTQNVTEKHAMEHQLRQVQKMDALGRIAGGVAHDFNNLLTVINGLSEMLEALTADPEVREHVAAIRDAGRRAASLTSQLLTFSRHQFVDPVDLDLNEAIDALAGMLRRLINEDIRIALRLDARGGRIRIDPGQLEQVLVNLAVNARDAMPRGGEIAIETRDVELEARDIALLSEAEPGPYVMLAVRDIGSGIDPTVKDRIFDPFFTTKAPGRGTGLGLATVYGIVRQNGGQIAVESEVGRGTTFRVYFPARHAASSPSRVAPPLESRSDTETILLVEDEESVRRVARLALRRRGFEVIEAANGFEAVAAASDGSTDIDLLISDVVMPDMSGPQLAATLRRARPELGVLFMSGYMEDAVLRHGVSSTGDAFIEKPFTPSELVRKVRDALDAGGHHEGV
ncbi:MAG: PAS domain S-box protein [Vicinamibacterales bacterium]